MRTVLRAILSLLPFGILLLAGWLLQRAVFASRAASFQDLNYVDAYTHLLYFQLALVAVFALLAALIARYCAVPRIIALLYLMLGLVGVLFMPLYLALGPHTAQLGLPAGLTHYLLFSGREIERLSWNLLAAFGLFALALRLLPQKG